MSAPESLDPESLGGLNRFGFGLAGDGDGVWILLCTGPLPLVGRLLLFAPLPTFIFGRLPSRARRLSAAAECFGFIDVGARQGRSK